MSPCMNHKMAFGVGLYMRDGTHNEVQETSSVFQRKWFHHEYAPKPKNKSPVPVPSSSSLLFPFLFLSVLLFKVACCYG